MRTLKFTSIFFFLHLLIAGQAQFDKAYNGVYPFPKNAQCQLISDDNYMYTYFVVNDTLKVYQGDGKGNWMNYGQLYIKPITEIRVKLFKGTLYFQMFKTTNIPSRNILYTLNTSGFSKLIDSTFMYPAAVGQVSGACLADMLVFKNKMYISLSGCDSIHGVPIVGNHICYNGNSFETIDTNVFNPRTKPKDWSTAQNKLEFPPFSMQWNDAFYSTRDTGSGFLPSKWDGVSETNMPNPFYPHVVQYYFFVVRNELYSCDLSAFGDQFTKWNGTTWVIAHNKFSTELLMFTATQNHFAEYKDMLYTIGGYRQNTGSQNYIDLFSIYYKGEWRDTRAFHPSQFKIKNASVVDPQALVFKDELYLYGVLDASGSGNDSTYTILKFTGTVNTISGKVYNDTDSNCAYSGGEKLPRQRLVEMNPGGYISGTDQNDEYGFIAAPGTCTLKVVPKRNWEHPGCQDSALTVTFMDSLAGNADTLDFAVRRIPNITDMSVKLSSLSGWRARRGFREYYRIMCNNNGSLSQPSTITLKMDARLDSFSSSLNPYSINDTEVVWKLDTLSPDKQIYIDFSAKNDTGSFWVGDSLGFAVSMETSPSDYYTDDNADTLILKVSASFDPNSKSVFPNGYADSINVILPKVNELTYHIHFENLGNDTAYTVVVADTIEYNLDIKYIQEQGSSHHFTREVIPLKQAYGKGLIKWTFDNIKLPPKNTNKKEDPINQGYISYKIRLKQDLPLKTIVSNKAYIYFDYNAAVITNDAIVKIDTPSVIKQDSIGTHQGINYIVRNESLKIYPNPSKDVIFFDVDESKPVFYYLTDMMGRNLVNGRISQGNAKHLDISSLPHGIYILNISQGETTSTAKFIKE